MIKRIVIISFTLVNVMLWFLSGCTFMIKGEHQSKYYGVNEQRDNEFLDQILQRQEEIYQARKISLGNKNP